MTRASRDLYVLTVIREKHPATFMTSQFAHIYDRDDGRAHGAPSRLLFLLKKCGLSEVVDTHPAGRGILVAHEYRLTEAGLKLTPQQMLTATYRVHQKETLDRRDDRAKDTDIHHRLARRIDEHRSGAGLKAKYLARDTKLTTEFVDRHLRKLVKAGLMGKRAHKYDRLGVFSVSAALAAFAAPAPLSVRKPVVKVEILRAQRDDLSELVRLKAVRDSLAHDAEILDLTREISALNKRLGRA